MLLLPKQPGSDVENIKNILTKENDCVETKDIISKCLKNQLNIHL